MAGLHVDTGMHRLGLPCDYDFTRLPPLQLELVMTHLPEQMSGATYAAEQLNRLLPVFRHCAASF